MFVAVLCCIFWSFTLCKNDLDFNDKSDSAMVLESRSSSSTINLSVCSANKPGGCSLTSLPVLTSINSSDFHLRRPFFFNIPLWIAWWAGAHHRSPVLRCCSVHELRGISLSNLIFPRLSVAVEASTSGSLSLHRETKFIIGFDFAVTLSSPESFFVFFSTSLQNTL